jgi:hypothetical protein
MKKAWQEFGESCNDGGSGLSENVVDRFIYANLAVFIVPLIPHSAVATSFTSCCCD